MKKSLLKIFTVFMAVLILQLQAMAGTSFAVSTADNSAVNFDENEIYSSFNQIDNLVNYVSENDVTYTDVQSYDNSLVANVSSDAAIALNTSNGGEPPIVSAFWWGCLLSWVGVIVVYVTTDSNPEYTKQAWKGCAIAAGCYVVSWLAYYILVIAAATSVSTY